MTHLLLLTPREAAELEMLSAHKHDCGLFNALEEVGSTIWGELIYEIPEHLATSVVIFSEWPDTGFVIRWNTSLGLKISRFLADVQEARKVA